MNFDDLTMRQTMPFAPESEQVVWALFCWTTHRSTGCRTLRPETFYRAENRVILRRLPVS